MPRFYFHTDSGRDLDGHDFPSLAVAKCEAIKMFGAIVCEDADVFWDKAEWTMTVTDERDLTLFQIHVLGTESAAGKGMRSDQGVQGA